MNRCASLWPAVAATALLSAGGARADSEYNARATFTTEKIVIDGKMDEPAWDTAPIYTGWHQTRLAQGKPARDQTEVRILYDRDNLYFGFHCLDSQPDKVVAYTVQNEGFLHQEDNVTVILDTFLDHRNAYYFWTNLLGVRTDGRIVDDGEAYTTDWQGEWEAKGAVVSDGWVLEMRLPFKNFKFPETEELTFGMMLDREVKHTQEWSGWTPDGVNAAKVSRYPHLTGIKGIGRPQVFTATPYVSAQMPLPASPLPNAPAGLPAQAPQPLQVAPNAGVDVRIEPTDWASLSLTLNPDFAQVDVDQDVLWLDTEERFIPERRQFFREGQHLFIAPLNVFYSRRIANKPHDRLLGGILATGKHGGVGFNLLNTLSLEGRSDGSMESVNAAVARVQVDIGKRSAVSLLGENRAGDFSHQLLGADANLHLFEEFFLQAQAVKTWSPDPSPGAEAYHVGLHRFDTLTEFWLQFEDVGKNFQAPLGFITSIDRRSLRSHLAFFWFTKLPVFRRLDFTYDGGLRWNHEGVQTRNRHNLFMRPYLGTRFALSLNGLYDETGGFVNQIGTFGFAIDPEDWQTFTLSAVGGRFLGGSMAGLNAALSWKLGSKTVVKLSGFYTRHGDIPANSPLHGTLGNGQQWAGYAQIRYHFSPDLYARVTFQRGSAAGITDLNLVEGQVIDALIGWHFREGSDAYLVYTEQPIAGQQERRILSKFAFAL